MNAHKKEAAFTLVELLAVMAIIGILIGLILPNTLRAIYQGQVTECQSDLRTINTAALQCFSETRDWTQCNNLQTMGQYFPNNNVPTTSPVSNFPNFALVQDGAVDGGYVADTASCPAPGAAQAG